LARIEVAKNEIPQLIALNIEDDVTRQLQSYGFKFVTIDLEGFRSGSLNRVLVSLGVNTAAGQTMAHDQHLHSSVKEVVG
jgi:uncharacterized protein